MTVPTTKQDEALTVALEQWKDDVLKELKGAPFEKNLLTRTFEEITLQPLYTRADVRKLNYISTAPAEAPFLRGCRHWHRGRAWRIAQEISAPTPAVYNQILLANLESGQDSVVIRCLCGERDRVEARSARLGSRLRLSTVAELEAALNNVDLDAVELQLYTGADPRPAAALAVALYEERGLAVDSVRGSVLADPLGEAVCCGRFLRDAGDRYGPLAEWTQWASKNAPHLRTVGVDASIWGDAGATATQELAFALAGAAEYIRALEALGVELYIVANHLQFQFSIGSQFFTEIAKFRAFRPLFTRMLMAFGAEPCLGRTASVGASTGYCNKTLLDPHVNMLRATTEALSAVLGGCDRLHIDPYDAASGTTSEQSRRIALNVHTLMAEEFGFASPTDAAGGSWYIEKLTDDLARAAWNIFQDLERHGGMAACIRSGYAQRLVDTAEKTKAGRVASRALPLVGTNLFPKPKEKAPTAVPPCQSNSEKPSAKEADLTARTIPRADEKWSFETAIANARDGANSDAWTAVLAPENDESVVCAKLSFRRLAEGFENLRREMDAVSLSLGHTPKVCVVKLGTVAQHRARAEFSAGFFSVGAFLVNATEICENPNVAAQAAQKSGAEIAVLCSTDDVYAVMAPAFAREYKRLNPSGIAILAGLPTDPVFVAQLQKAGFDEFIYLKANCEELLTRLIRKIGGVK